MTIKEKLKWSYDVKTNWIQTVLRILLGSILLFSGISHLTISRLDLVAQVPAWVLLPTDLVVVLSGIIDYQVIFPSHFGRMGLGGNRRL